MNKMHRLHLHCSRTRPYGAGEKRLSRARRSRAERSRWWPPCRDAALAVAPREAKILRLRRGCGGRKLLIIFRSVDPSSGKWRVLTNAFSCTGREGGWAAALPGTPSCCPLSAPFIHSAPLPMAQGLLHSPTPVGALPPPPTALLKPDPLVGTEAAPFKDQVLSFKGVHCVFGADSEHLKSGWPMTPSRKHNY